MCLRQLQDLLFALLGFLPWSTFPSLRTLFFFCLLEWEGVFCAIVYWKDRTCFLILQDVAIKKLSSVSEETLDI